MTHNELLSKMARNWNDPKAFAALRAVVELHKNHGESWSPNGELRPTSNTCEGCRGYVPYPCPTIQAIEKELG